MPSWVCFTGKKPCINCNKHTACCNAFYLARKFSFLLFLIDLSIFNENTCERVEHLCLSFRLMESFKIVIGASFMAFCFLEKLQSISLGMFQHTNHTGLLCMTRKNFCGGSKLWHFKCQLIRNINRKWREFWRREICFVPCLLFLHMVQSNSLIVCCFASIQESVGCPWIAKVLMEYSRSCQTVHLSSQEIFQTLMWEQCSFHVAKKK